MSRETTTLPDERPAATAGLTAEPGWLQRAGHRLSRTAAWLGDRLTRRWWNEPDREYRRRWQRFVLHGPIGLIVGLAFGILAGQRWGIDPAVLGIVCGVAGVVFMYLVGQAESFLRNGIATKWAIPGPALQVGADLVGGGLMGWVLSTVLDSHGAATLAMGASVLAAYGYVASRLLWGSLVDDLVWFLTGNAAGARGPDYSRQEALAVRGRVDEALALYEEECRRRPGHADPMIHAAWMLREAGRYEESVAWYERALATPNLEPRRAAIFCRHIWEVTATKLGGADAALPHLERLLAHHPDAEELEWARREVREMGGTLPPTTPPPDDQSAASSP